MGPQRVKQFKYFQLCAPLKNSKYYQTFTFHEVVSNKSEMLAPMLNFSSYFNNYVLSYFSPEPLLCLGPLCESCSVVSNSLQYHGLYSLCNSPDQNPGVGSLSFLQWISPTLGSNQGLLHYRQILYQLSHSSVQFSLVVQLCPTLWPPESCVCMGVCVQTQMYFLSYFNNSFNFVLNIPFTLNDPWEVLDVSSLALSEPQWTRNYLVCPVFQ